MKINSKSTPVFFTKNNQVQLVQSGAQYFDLFIRLIQNAKQSIHIQTYIFADDETGNQIAIALKNAAQRGVAVYLLVDGYASQNLTNKFIVQLKEAGIHFRFFEPIFKNNYFYFGRRLHHKVVVIDIKFALVGGLNIANHYNDLPSKPAWLDFALYVEGEICQQLYVLCLKTWNGFIKSTAAAVYTNTIIDFKIPVEKQVDIKMIRNDWVRRKNEISNSYLNMFKSSRKEIIILCSYFFPGRKIRRQMTKAISRGVTIKVVVAGVSDVMISKYAERWLYDWLLRNGIEIYEYQNNILHAKVAVCDDHWMTIGSYNINDISAYASIEMNLVVKNTTFCKKVSTILDQIISNECVKISDKNLKKSNSIFSKFLKWCAYQAVRTLFYIFTFYFKQRN